MKKLFLLFVLAASMYVANAQITAPLASTEIRTEEDAHYLEPLPLEDGKVYLLRELQLPAGNNPEDTFAKLQIWMDRCMKDARITRHTDIPSDQPHTIQQQINQTLTFSDKLLALDQTNMEYLLTLSLQGDKIQLKMSHIHYRYNGENRDRKMLRYSAEDHIADAVALNKNRTKLIRGYKKFRIKTIDLIDEFESSLKTAFWAN